MIRVWLYDLAKRVFGAPQATVRIYNDARIVVVRCNRCGSKAVIPHSSETEFYTDHDCPGQMLPIVVPVRAKESAFGAGFVDS